jgi:two-component system KDP operon response regulator KdpE
MTSVLLVEDDRNLRRTLRATLQTREFDVVEAASGEEALSKVTSDPPDLVVLDLGLPGIDGLETLRHLRTFSSAPIIVLTVRDGLNDKVAALEYGADDYVLKPFETEELIARARAHLRRAVSSAPAPTRLVDGPLTIDLAARLVTLDGAPVALTPTEWRLLDALVTHRGTLVSHNELTEAVWGSSQAAERARLRVFVLQLRRKLRDDATRPRLFVNEPGLGYRWIGESDAAGDAVPPE